MKPINVLLVILVVPLWGCKIDLEPPPIAPDTLINNTLTTGTVYTLALSTGSRQTIELTVTRKKAITVDCRGYAYVQKPNASGFSAPFLTVIGKDDLLDFPLPDIMRVVDTNGINVTPPTASVTTRTDLTQVSQMTFEGLKSGTADVVVGIVCYPGDYYGGVAAYTTSAEGYIRVTVK
jgi:hypothetical protein